MLTFSLVSRKFLAVRNIALYSVYSEKAKKISEIPNLLLSYIVQVKSKVEVSKQFWAFSEYMNFNRGCLVRFTHMWYQISPCSWLGFWHLPQFKLRLGNHISDLRSQNWGQHSGFSEENRPKVGFFWKFQKMQFPAFGFKKWDFFWVWGVEKGPTNFFPCQKA